MKKALTASANKYFGESQDFRVRIFNTLGLLGFLLGLAFGTFAFFIHPSPINIVANYSASAVAIIVILLANKTGRYKLFFLLTVVLVFVIIFPALFFMGGGITSGMPSFFVFAVVFTVIMMEGRRRAIFTAAEIALYLICFLVAYYRPETVAPFPAETNMLKDIIVGCLGSTAVLAIAIYQHIAVYDLKQKELEKANAALESLNHMKTEFLQNISHELRTPLTVMINYAIDTLSELREETLSVPEMEFNQNRIKGEGERLKRMVSQLLDVTAIEGGQRKICKGRVSLAALLSRMADANFNALDENGNRAVLDIQDSLPDIAADMDSIEQVLLNLISNAARHTKGGVITLRLSASGGYQEVRVSDTGEGISPDVLEQVFLRYVERESRVTGRSGLGLYICKKHIDAHGGEMGIESRLGHGTAVWFRLPVDNAEGKHI
ncbi:MAG: HAMP domain-containing histidine kinase [Clostridiales Family XIII bacterium]|jgi:signal transduction histidine kinase|nr:HAMP domain-containing histidine kinase [Clostridiales Family XIII bacterium]